MLYVPPAFAERDPAKVRALIDAAPFATVFAYGPDATEPMVSHLPLLAVDAAEAPAGFVLAGHMARANEQWRRFAAGARCLAIFHGPHAYVSARWYAPAPAQVPTWNYAVVHVSGRVRPIEDAARTMATLARQLDRFGDGGFVDVGSTERRALLKAIVAFEIDVDQVVAKYKLSQNRTPEDQARVRRELLAGGEEARAVAALMNTARDGRE